MIAALRRMAMVKISLAFTTCALAVLAAAVAFAGFKPADHYRESGALITGMGTAAEGVFGFKCLLRRTPQTSGGSTISP
jgi:hypothetical protein